MAADLSADDYRQAFERIQHYIQAGDCYQVNFAQRFRASCQGDPWLAYCKLREACPTPFSGFQSLPDGGAVLSLSPERFVKVSQRQVETRPIKGTRPRGLTPAEDAANAAELLASPKDRAENLMIVDSAAQRPRPHLPHRLGAGAGVVQPGKLSERASPGQQRDRRTGG
jgi:para-aminobenzoate synthetase component 1